MFVEVTTWHLEMTSPDALRPKRSARADVAVERVDGIDPELNRHLYATVGAGWQWIDRLPWPRERWIEYLSQPGLETWVMHAGGEQAGYFELHRRDDGDVEIVYFGLFPAFIGEGLGGHLLTAAVEAGWQPGTKRVWLHTCSLDHPVARNNYESRGFRLFRTEKKLKDVNLPDDE